MAKDQSQKSLKNNDLISKASLRELEILKFWQENQIFKKTLEKPAPKGEFIFYEGPPTANGHPGIHHLEARAFKDAIPRYKTMQGFHVPRKGGWDTHGLPVEIQVEKELGLKSKKEIEKYGIAAFNAKCKESVWKFVHEWEDFTDRSGYWVDLKNPYITYKSKYIEALWGIVKKVDDQKLLYKDYKVVPWCPRCGTALSSHELAQGYADVKDLAVTIKFKILDSRFPGAYLLAWTTTPWTLPGNVGLAVGEKIDYVQIELGADKLILAKERLNIIKGEYKILEEFTGKKLIGLEYEALYSFLKDNISGPEKEKLPNAFKVYPADFVTTTDGTGIVHTAVMYGQDDFDLGNKVGLPKFHLVNEDGTFKKEAGFLAGKFVKDEATDVEIIKELAARNLLFAKEKYSHSYPHCWRCKTPLIYFARDSWYIKMSNLREGLIKENEKIHWEPDYIKEGRFGEWLREVKDWAISRERYWGTPLPVWICEKCGNRKVVGSIEDLGGKPRNEYFAIRHGESEGNVKGVLNSKNSPISFKLTELGRENTKKSAKKLKGKIDVIYASPLDRTRETAEIVADAVGYPKDQIVFDERLREMEFSELDNGPEENFQKLFADRRDYFTKSERGVENRLEIKRRVGDFLESIDRERQGKKILIVSHSAPIWMLVSAAQGLDIDQMLALKPRGAEYIDNSEIKTFEYRSLPRNKDFELDLHRPFIDEVKFFCDCTRSKNSDQVATMTRVKEVMDVWFDSGSMPFAQGAADLRGLNADQRGIKEEESSKKIFPYPADFISEAIDQTRGWFYTLLAVGVLMGKGTPYKNVICLGHILDGEGKKMSKSVGNVVDPFRAIEKYGADALRFWMYSVNQPGEPKNFDEKTVDEVVKKVFNLADNVLAFYQLYSSSLKTNSHELKTDNVLDQWILARLAELTAEVTKGLDSYKLLEPTRAIRDFIADFSQWYIRRSRDRFKGDDEADKAAALQTTRFVLLELSKLMAPFTPFFADHLYKTVGGEKESVHLESWPEENEKLKAKNEKLIEEMQEVRRIVSLGLEARAKANIKVRQPLQKLQVKSCKLQGKENYTLLIKDEVNVKEIVFAKTLASEVELDLEITPELKKEGDLRDLIRRIQELRKEKGLKPGELATLVVGEKVFAGGLISEFESEIKKAASLSKIERGGEGEELTLK